MALLRWQSYPASEAAASLARPTLKGCFPASLARPCFAGGACLAVAFQEV